MADSDDWRFQALEKRVHILEAEMKEAIKSLAILSGIAENRLEVRSNANAMWGWIVALGAGLMAAVVAWFTKK